MRIRKVVRTVLPDYLLKETVNSKYIAHMDGALISGVGTGIALNSFHGSVSEIGITAFLGSFCLSCLKEAFKYRAKLAPIKARAIAIKKAAKAAKLNKTI